MMFRDLLDDPAFPHWGRTIILEAWRAGRDPVDTANVLEALARAADAEAQELLDKVTR